MISYYCFYSFYIPPDSNIEPITELQQSLTILLQNKSDDSVIFLSGDFNLPSIKWNDN